MRNRPPKSTRRQGELAMRMASDFDAAPLHNTVHDTVGEDDQLAALCDAAAEAERASELRSEYLVGDKSGGLTAVSDAADQLAHAVEPRAHEVVAECCQRVIVEGDEWIAEGVWDAATVKEAQAEATAWLKTYTNAAKRAQVLDVLEVDA